MIQKEKLEELLVKNWAKFLDSKKLLAKVLQDANAATPTFSIVKSAKAPEKNAIQISISRFQLADAGFLIWTEFVIPRDTGTHIGTAEYQLLNTGELGLRQIMGTTFTKATESPA